MKELVGMTPGESLLLSTTAPIGPFRSVPLIQWCKLAKTLHFFSFWFVTLLHIHSALAYDPQISFQGKQSRIYLQHIIIYFSSPFGEKARRDLSSPIRISECALCVQGRGILVEGFKGKKNVNPGQEPVFLDAFHVMCFYSAKSRNTPQGSES